MITFIGDYPCKLDDKGRVLLPAAFLRQMANARQEKFILKKDLFELCLVLYPMNEWEKQNELIMQNTNIFNREHNKFLRGFFKGMAEVTMDSSNRILLPRRLLDEIGASREVIMAGQSDRIEIWTREGYETVEGSGENFAQLAEKIMGNLNRESRANNNKGE